MKKHADKKRRASYHNITAGQQVLITNNTPHRNKYTPRWLPTPGVVTGVKGNGIFITHNNKNIMRSSSQVKPYFTQSNSSTHTKISKENVSSSSSDSDCSEYVFSGQRQLANDTALLPNDNDAPDNNMPNDSDIVVMPQLHMMMKKKLLFQN